MERLSQSMQQVSKRNSFLMMTGSTYELKALNIMQAVLNKINKLIQVDY